MCDVMLCSQCEQTIRAPDAVGCRYKVGICGKTAETANCQDLLVAVLQGLGAWANEARKLGIRVIDADLLAPEAYFACLTNVNFDSERIIDYLKEAIGIRENLRKQIFEKIPEAAASRHPRANIQIPWGGPKELAVYGRHFAMNCWEAELGTKASAIRMLSMYSLKGAAAYLAHSIALGGRDEKIFEEFQEISAFLGTMESSLDEQLRRCIGLGQTNVRIMALLEGSNTACFGDPVPSKVNLRTKKGKAILVSGHDMPDLYDLLQQGLPHGVNLYTHGEMLPSHGYPKLKAFPNLIGNFGTAWHNQQTEFAKFPGPVVMTSNCLINPFPGAYADRMWCRNMVAWPGAHHHVGSDYSEIIKQALEMPGFTEDEEPFEITVGYGQNLLLSCVDRILDLFTQKKLRHVFVIGGCDGRRAGRDYYTQLARLVPEDCVIITMGCKKYRFNTLNFGEIDGFPRLIDAGQCNDSYSAVQLALALATRLGCSVADLPLTLVLGWLEQKALIILLSVLALGFTNLYSGPTGIDFLDDDLQSTLANKFGLRTLGDPQEDLERMLAANNKASRRPVQEFMVPPLASMPTQAVPNSLTVVSVEQETPEAFTVQLLPRVPLRYKPGQFCLFAVTRDTHQMRAYTLSSTPGVSPLVSVSVLRRPGGLGSKWFTEHVKPGDIVWSSDAMGNFSCVDAPAESYLFLARRNGITPMMSNTRWLLEKQPGVSIVILYHAKGAKDHMFREEFASLEAKHGRLFRVLYLNDTDLTEGELLQHVADYRSRMVFCCGSRKYVENNKDLLTRQLELPLEQFKTEAFEATEVAVVSDGPQVSIKVKHGASSWDFQGFSKANLLASLEEAGVPLAAGCRQGVCGCCKVKVTKGIVSQELPPGSAITEEEKEAGYALACCSKAETGVEIEW